MSMTAVQAGASGGFLGFLDRSRTLARPGFNRWMVPPAALCIHLCIGQAYAFSVSFRQRTHQISQNAPKNLRLGMR